MKTFREFLNEKTEIGLIIESFKPIKTNYGTNYPEFDNQIIEDIDNNYITAFKLKNELIYYVFLDKNNEVTFSSFDGWTDNQPFINNALNSKEGNLKNNRSANLVFSNVFYIISEMVKINKPNNIKFRGMGKLNKLYNLLVRNKVFIKEMSKLGYIYSKSINGEVSDDTGTKHEVDVFEFIYDN